jgi:hypothetical protein
MKQAVSAVTTPIFCLVDTIQVDYDDEQDAQGETDEEYDPILSIEDMPPVSATVSVGSGYLQTQLNTG